jgi:hypothetical protein
VDPEAPVELLEEPAALPMVAEELVVRRLAAVARSRHRAAARRRVLRLPQRPRLAVRLAVVEAPWTRTRRLLSSKA